MNENDLKSMEARLRTWRPRRPSATLKWRLFLVHAAKMTRVMRIAGCLTPATACVLLAILSFNSGFGARTRVFSGLSIPEMMSNQSYAVYVTSQDSEQNNLAASNFDWTNRNGLRSTVTFAPSKTTD
jgi:hypothetical protein